MLRRDVLVVVLAVCVLGACKGRSSSASKGSGSGQRKAGSASEILWDTYGVPHIQAGDDEALFYGFGHAQMASHADLILRLYGRARGRAAEYWGAAELASDRDVRTMGIPARGQAWYAAQSPSFRRSLDAFAAGMNAYAAAHRDRIDDSVEIVLPVTGADVLAHAAQLFVLFVVKPQSPGGPPGSNAWAIGPTKSSSKHAMLLSNPHLPWDGPFMFYEAQLTAPGVDVYGATLVGLPVLVTAFNDHLGWAHTINTQDGADLYALTTVEGGYQWDGEPRAFETRDEIIRVKEADGRLRDDKLTIRSSVHGPIVSESGGKPLALRMVGLDRASPLETWWDMARARDLAAFETSLRRMQLPAVTVTYADDQGNILHSYGGLTPVRKTGDWNLWQGTVAGDTSDTLWTDVHDYASMPKVLNPASGWLQNTNDPPWWCTLPAPLSPKSFPAYLAPAELPFPNGFRTQRSLHMLEAEPPMSLERMIELKHSTHVELADRVLPDLIAAARKSKSPLVVRAADVLDHWDRATDAESRGAVLFENWAWSALIMAPQPFAKPWDAAAAATTPTGLADVGGAVRALEGAAGDLERSGRSLDVSWGEANRIRRDGVDLPANGANSILGVFRAVQFDEAPDKKANFAVGGDSFVAAVELSKPVRAQVLLVYGNASQPGSPHRTDQLSLFSKKQLRPVWRDRRDVEAHLESRESLAP